MCSICTLISKLQFVTTNVNAYKLEHGGHVHPPVLALIILPSTKGEGQNISFELSFDKCESLYQHAINSIISCWYFYCYKQSTRIPSRIYIYIRNSNTSARILTLKIVQNYIIWTFKSISFIYVRFKTNYYLFFANRNGIPKKKW